MASSSGGDRSARPVGRAELLPGVSDPRLLAAYAAAQPWLRRSYVTGLGIGYARKGGRPTRELALSVHVSKRLPDGELSARQRFPRTLLGVRVDVVQANLRPHLSQEEVQARRRTAAIPLRPGVLLKTEGGDLGTVALMVRGRTSGENYVLGAGHVMLQSGTTVFQPNSSAAKRLTISVEQVERSLGDAGIASYTGRAAENRPYGTDLVIGRVRDVRLDDRLTMSGAFSGLTVGKVDWVGQKPITYADGLTLNVPGFQLRPVTEGDSLTQPGDSGALWFDRFGAAVGINVGGKDDTAVAIEGDEADSTPWAFACHLVKMMDQLDVEL
ncbi:hypothetical protein [Roseateles flavus]|uniref:Serine protease n=1 Tax=Roseateles flavus TaxID=3149041 RepID=A0ABV0GGG4_9BURK